MAEESVARFVEHFEAVTGAAKAGKFMVASQKTVAEKSVAKVAGNSEPVSVAAKTGKFMVASQKTEVSSREARVARPQGFHPGQGSTALRRAHSAVFPHALVPGQGSTAFGGASSSRFVLGQSSTARRGADIRSRRVCTRFLGWTRVRLWRWVHLRALMGWSFTLKPQP